MSKNKNIAENVRENWKDMDKYERQHLMNSGLLFVGGLFNLPLAIGMYVTRSALNLTQEYLDNIDKE